MTNPNYDDEFLKPRGKKHFEPQRGLEEVKDVLTGVGTHEQVSQMWMVNPSSHLSAFLAFEMHKITRSNREISDICAIHGD